MYYFFKGLEFICNFIRIKCKIVYWKLKYGNRIQIGKNLKFRKRMNINITKHGFVRIGNNNFFNNDCSINCHSKIVIGNDNLFGENVKIYDHNHIFNDKKVDYTKTFSNGKIVIGNHNWICTNVVLIKDTMLGNYNVIATGINLKGKIDSEELIKECQNIDIKKIIYK